MKKIFDETYESDGVTSRNVWVSELPLLKKIEYGKIVDLNDPEKQDSILSVIKEVLAEEDSADEYNFYFYSDQTTKDALDENIRPSLMVQISEGRVFSHINMSDYDFAVNLQNLLDASMNLEEKIEEIL